MLFVACRQYGVELIDVSDPASPQHQYHTDRRGPVGHRAERHPVRRRLGCVGGSGGGRTQPVEAANHIAPLDGYGDGIDVRGDYLYAATAITTSAAASPTGDLIWQRAWVGGAGHHRSSLTETRDACKIPANVQPTARHVGRYDCQRARLVCDTHNGVFLLNVRERVDRVVGHWTAARGGGRFLVTLVD